MNSEIEILSDNRGAYGIEVDNGPWEPFNSDAICDSQPIYFRPDKVSESVEIPQLFHALPSKMMQWAKGSESRCQAAAVAAMCRRRGIRTAEYGDNDAQFWRRYHPARQTATAVLNTHIKACLESIPKHWLKTVRRFPVRYRPHLYRMFCADGDRAWQLAESCPTLAAHLSSSVTDNAQMAREAVARGVPLREALMLVNMPAQWRHFPPAVVDWVFRASPILQEHSDLIGNCAPATVPKMRKWLGAIAAAHEVAGADYGRWIAKNGMALGNWRAIPEIAKDMGDWVYQCRKAEAVNKIDADQARLIGTVINAGNHLDNQLARASESARLIERPFTAEMEPQTAMELSDRWHLASSRLSASGASFPDPWLDGAEVDGFTIEPIGSGVDLTQAARQFRNCASSYADRIAAGESFLYTAVNGKSSAMFEIVRGAKPQLGEIRAPFNAPASAAATNAIRKWHRYQVRNYGVGRMPEQSADPFDIPF